MSWGGLIGGVVSGATAAAVANANKKEAAKNRQFQRYMSNTAHRRAVRDLRAAGLNPILAAGSPASTPGGAQARIDLPDIAGAISKTASTSLAAQRLKQELGNMQATENLSRVQAEREREQAAVLGQSARKTAAEATITELAIPAAAAQAEYDVSSTGQFGKSVKRFLEEYPVLEFLGGAGFAKLLQTTGKKLGPHMNTLGQFESGKAATRGTGGYRKRGIRFGTIKGKR